MVVRVVFLQALGFGALKRSSIIAPTGSMTRDMNFPILGKRLFMKDLGHLGDSHYTGKIYDPSGIIVGDGTIDGERNPQRCKTKSSTNMFLD